MVENSHFMGQDGFVWFVGVVEDRIDPSALGRVRVRCLGYHTASVIDLPTTDLPWAHVMHPVTDPSMHGMGNTPSFLVEGSYVVGFFRDVEKQQLVIMGTLPGIPEEEANPKLGFNDPRGKKAKQDAYKGDPVYGPYPVDGEDYTMSSGHEVGEPDTNRLAQGETSETHTSLINRRTNRLSGDFAIPIATQPFLKSVSDEAIQETRGTFEEPQPKGISSTAEPYTSGQYPYNHVFESESGHIREIDDSPGAERLFTQHKSGTFEEIHPDGTKVVKIIGDNYEIIAGSSNVYISGNVNITTEGTVREYIKGDYHLEVEGNYTQKIHKNLRTRVGASGSGNLEEEIMGNHAFNINGYVKGNVGPLDGSAAPGEGDVDINIVGNETHIVGNNLTLHAQANTLFSTGNNMLLTATSNMNLLTTSGIMSIKSGKDPDTLIGGQMDIRSEASMTIKTEANMNMTTSGIKKEVVTGAAHETFSSTYYVDYKGENHFTHSGIQWYMRGADYHARHEAGVDYACSSDTSRTSANDCTDLTLPTSP